MIQLGNVSYQTNPQPVYVDLINGTITAADSSRIVITPYANGWYRISTTVTTNTSGASVLAQIYASSGVSAGSESFTGDSTSGVFVWGAMVQKSGLPLRAIPVGLASAAESASVAKDHGATRYEIIFSDATRQLVNFGSGSSAALPIETQNWHQRFVSRIRYMA